MKSLVKTRNWIIIILCFTIICMGIGFAVLSMELENQKNNHPKFSLEFTKAEQRSLVQGGLNTPNVNSSIINSGQTININFELYAPRDEIGYKVIIKNTGNVKAEIVNIIEKPDYINDLAIAQTILPVKISHNNISGKTLEPDEEVELNIVAIFDYNGLPMDMKIPYQLSLLTKSIE